MLKRKVLAIACLSVALTLTTLTAPYAYAYSAGTLLRKEMRNDEVVRLQQDLKSLGYLQVTPTGYFGNLTESAVMDFQRHHGLTQDGLAGEETISRIISLVQTTDPSKQTPVSRGAVARNTPNREDSIQQLPWFGRVESLFARGDVAKVIDVETGLAIQVKRTYGTNHADVETMTKEDTAILKQIAGGEWNWVRRPVIVEVHGYRIAASMTPMPHAGRDDLPALQTVNNRSGGFGRGTNLDEIKGNGMHGHIDIHFYGSKTHGSSRVDRDHQKAIQDALNSGL